jgi:PKD repeat protein
MPDPTPIAVRWAYKQNASRPRLSDEVLTVGAPTVDWTYRALADPRQIQFISQHTGIVTTWLWDFGQAEITSPVRNPIFQYYLGTAESAEFTVRLTINGSIFEEKTITVYNLIPLPGPLDLDVHTLTIDEAHNMTVEQVHNMTVT